MGVKLAVVILMCPLLAMPQRDRTSEYYARPLGWGSGASNLDRGSYYSGSHRSGSSETQVNKGSYGSGYPGAGMMGAGMLGTGLGAGLYGGRGYYAGSHSSGMSSISSTRCIQTRATKDTTTCEKNLENEVRKIPKGSSDYHKKVCCLAASADKCHERVSRAVGCEGRILPQGTRSRQWMQQYIGNHNCGTYDCGGRTSSTSYRTGYSNGYGVPYGTGHGTSYGMGHGGYRYPYGYGLGSSLRATWAVVIIVIVACLLFTKYSR